MFVGGTHAHGDEEFTLGVEGGVNLNSNWSVGGVFEQTERGKRSTLYLVGVGWHPLGPELRFQLGVGKKYPAGERETVYRTGVAYEIPLRHKWFAKPYLAVDFIENESNEQVYGVYLGRVF